MLEQPQSIPRIGSSMARRGDSPSRVSCSSNAGAHAVDVLQPFDDDRDFSRRIDDVEFHRTMKRTFGYKGSLDVMREVFRQLPHANGTIALMSCEYLLVTGRRIHMPFPTSPPHMHQNLTRCHAHVCAVVRFVCCCVSSFEFLRGRAHSR